MKLFQQFPYGHLDELGNPVVRRFWPRQPAWAVASISDVDAAFFAGLVMETRPLKLLEIGVASGWGSCILLEALGSVGLDHGELHAVDVSDRFFYDAAYGTGQCVADVLPERLKQYRLITGATIGECAAKIGPGIDFVFIDAHHMHPWATLDLLAVMPYVRPGSWVAMHDLNLSRKEDQEHQNRGPKYLFEGWDGDRLHSIQEPTMAGAIRISDEPSDHLPLLLDILHTPWELPIEARATEPVCAIIGNAYGDAWARKFRRAMELGNYQVSKVHSPDIDRMQREMAAMRDRRIRWIRRLFGERAE